MKFSFVPIFVAVTLLTGCVHGNHYGEVKRQLALLEECADTDDSLCNVIRQNVYRLATDGIADDPDASSAVELVRILADMKLAGDGEILHLISLLGRKNQNEPEIAALRDEINARNEALTGRRFTDGRLLKRNGSHTRLGEYAGRGSYCLVNFWASWCPAGREQFRQIQALREKYGRNLFVMSVAMWDNPKAAADTLKARGVRWDNFAALNDGELADAYSIEALPFNLLVSPRGIVVGRDLYVGDLDSFLSEKIR